MSFRRFFSFSLCLAFCFSFLAADANAQDRDRVVQENTSRTTETQQTKSTSKPTLTNQIVVQSAPPLVKKTGSSQPTGAIPVHAASKNAVGVSMVMKSQLMSSINSKLGIPYLYGSTGPNRYDCSGFVWSIFNESGLDFDRSSASTYWNQFESVTGDDRYKFGTLVFFNGLGHMGIVADENGFYHASSSKGVTYSKFKGYWENRIVGYRRIPVEHYSVKTIEFK